MGDEAGVAGDGRNGDAGEERGGLVVSCSAAVMENHILFTAYRRISGKTLNMIGFASQIRAPPKHEFKAPERQVTSKGATQARVYAQKHRDVRDIILTDRCEPQSLLGLDRLAKQKREERGEESPTERAKRQRVAGLPSFQDEDANPDPETDADGFAVPRAVERRQFRGPRIETPSHPGGVDARAAERIRQREREMRDRGRHATSRHGDHSRDRRDDDRRSGGGDRDRRRDGARHRDRDGRRDERRDRDERADRSRGREGRGGEWEVATPRRRVDDDEWALTPARPGSSQRNARDSGGCRG